METHDEGGIPSPRDDEAKPENPDETSRGGGEGQEEMFRSEPSPPPGPEPSLTAGEPAEGTLFYVDPREVDPSPTQGRQSYDPDAYAALRESILHEGRIIVPAIGYTRADGRYELVDGHTRRAIAEELGFPLPLIVRETLPVTAAVQGIAANLLRTDQTAYERGLEFRSVLAVMERHEGGEASQRQLARRVGMENNTISEYIKIATLLTPDLANRAQVDWENAITLGKKVLLRILSNEDSDRQAIALSRQLTGSIPTWAAQPHRAKKTAVKTWSFVGHKDATQSVRYRVDMPESELKKMLREIRQRIRSARESRPANGQGAS